MVSTLFSRLLRSSMICCFWFPMDSWVSLMNCSWLELMDSVEIDLSVSPSFSCMSLEMFSLSLVFSSRVLILAISSARAWMRCASELRSALTSSSDVANLWFTWSELDRSISSWAAIFAMAAFFDPEQYSQVFSMPMMRAAAMQMYASEERLSENESMYDGMAFKILSCELNEQTHTVAVNDDLQARYSLNGIIYHY